jgi:hypothetical protein
MENNMKATLNHFKSWWQREVIDKSASLEDKQKLLAALEGKDDPTVYDISDEMIEFIRGEIE